MSIILNLSTCICTYISGPKVPATDCGDLDLFKCKNGRCVSPYLICNNIDDCGDATDEMDCCK